MSNRVIVPTLFIITFAAIVIFGVVKWLQIPAGSLIDWVVGVAGFWWLTIITTVPWDTYFEAKEVLQEARISQSKDMKVNAADVQYAENISRRFLITAVLLHIISAGALYALAYFGVSQIGYWGSGMAILMTGLRPSARWYEYIRTRLYAIRQEVRYPREDAYELKIKLEELQGKVEKIEEMLNTENKDSAWSKQTRTIENLRNDLRGVEVNLEKHKVQNAADHDRIIQKSEATLSKLTEDSQFLNQVRELIRFIKSA
jgi:hypothetical protein